MKFKNESRFIIAVKGGGFIGSDDNGLFHTSHQGGASFETKAGLMNIMSDYRLEGCIMTETKDLLIENIIEVEVKVKKIIDPNKYFIEEE
jgi:hypothetical protein